jgi:methionine aminopeptidase
VCAVFNVLLVYVSFLGSLSWSTYLKKYPLLPPKTHISRYNTVRHASEVHREVRKWAQSWIKPGIKLIDMCEKIEAKNRQLVEERGLQAGIAFPTGCSINHVAAHFTPNCGDTTVLQEGDVMSIDFGTQIDGRIIDSAWTLCFQEQFLPLLEVYKSHLFFVFHVLYFQRQNE